jgi:hypothetical protein
MKLREIHPTGECGILAQSSRMLPLNPQLSFHNCGIKNYPRGAAVDGNGNVHVAVKHARRISSLFASQCAGK